MFELVRCRGAAAVSYCTSEVVLAVREGSKELSLDVLLKVGLFSKEPEEAGGSGLPSEGPAAEG